MTPEDLEGLLNQYTTNAINNIFTSIPCRVTAVNLDIQSVDVEILVDRVDTSGASHKHSIITDVPLMFPASRSSAFTFPVNINDTVLCVFSQRSIDRIKQGGTTSGPPLSWRKYSKADAIAIPGLFSFPDAVNNPSKHNLPHNTQDAVVSHNIGTASETEFRLKSNGDISITTPGKIDVNCQQANINAESEVNITSPQTTVTGAMLVNGPFTYTEGLTGSGGGTTASISGNIDFNDGTLTHNGVNIGDTHTHEGVESGPDTSGPPTS